MTEHLGPSGSVSELVTGVITPASVTESHFVFPMDFSREICGADTAVTCQLVGLSAEVC